jgi:N-formylglutamate deformylase
MSQTLWRLDEADSPVIATAIHDGHLLRPEVAERMGLTAVERLLEEDPHTCELTKAAPTRLVVQRSRFEMDLNRPRPKAVYLRPEDSWGLQVWDEPPPEELVQRSLEQYEAFYERAEAILRRAAEEHGAFVVLDMHSYNHRRGGPDAPPEDPQENPEINVGTGTLDPSCCGSVAKRFMHDLAAQQVRGRLLDVRENVRFTGGHFCEWVHDRFPDAGCCLAIEAKKTFMDEHTAAVDRERLEALREALTAAVPGAVEELPR